MNPKENPAVGGEGFLGSCFKTATQGSSHSSPAQASSKPQEVKLLKLPKPDTQLWRGLLMLSSGREVSISDIARGTGSTSAQNVSCDLRTRYGFTITNRQEQTKQGRESWYLLHDAESILEAIEAQEPRRIKKP